MKRTTKAKQRELKPHTAIVTQCNFTLQITSDEAFQFIHNPQGKVAKGLRKYMNDLLGAIARKCLADEKQCKFERNEM